MNNLRTGEPNRNRYIRQETGKKDVLSLLKDGNVFIGLSAPRLAEQQPITHGLTCKYSQNALEILMRSLRLQVIESDNTFSTPHSYPKSAFGVDVTNFSQIPGIVQVLRKRISQTQRGIGAGTAKIIIVGTLDGITEASNAINPDPRIQSINIQFLEELYINIQGIMHQDAKKTWKLAYNYLSANSYKTDCGISSLSNGVAAFKSIGQKFASRQEILTWVMRLSGDV